MARIRMALALAIALPTMMAPSVAGAQIVAFVDGVRQDIPANTARTVTVRNGRVSVRDEPWSGDTLPGAASFTTTETTDEDEDGRVLSRTLVTRIEPQRIAYAAPTRVVIQAPQPVAYAPPQPAYAPPRIDVDPDVLDDAPAMGEARPLRIKRDSFSGHFVAPVVINGVRLKSILDTGAAVTVLSAEDARRSGADREIIREEAMVGIGGYTRVGVARLASLAIGGRELGRITARIGQPGIPYTLLGQPEIARLGRITIENGVMTIEPRPVQLASR